MIKTSKYDNGKIAEPIKDRIKRKTLIDKNGCWVWQGIYFNKWGYAKMSVGSRRNGTKEKNTYVHRVSYEAFVGKIPEGLAIDHLCLNKKCVNPKHLEPVTTAENNRRKDMLNLACKKCGIKREFKKRCITCNESYKKNYYLKRKTLLLQ